MSMITTNRRNRAGAMQAVAGMMPVLRDLAKFQGVYADIKKQSQQGRPPPPPRRQKGPPVAKGIDSIVAPVSQGASSNGIRSKNVVRQTANGMTISGITVLGAVYNGSNSSLSLPNCALFAPSNPLTFPDRTQVMASIYDKYVYRKVTLRFIPSVSTASSGQVAVAIDRDYMDPPQNKSWSEVLNYSAVGFGSVWAAHSCSMTRDTSERRSYFTNFSSDSTLRESEQFKFYCFTNGCARNVLLGQLMLEYELELVSPVFAPDEVSSNLSLCLVKNLVLGTTWNAPTLSSIFTLAGMPSNSDAVDCIFEVNCQVPPVNPSGILTLGSGGPTWVPPNEGSFTFFCRPNFGTPGTASYFVYLSYKDALSRSLSQLYNPSAAAVTLVATTTSVSYRQLSFSAATS